MLKFRMSQNQQPDQLPDQKSCVNLNQGSFQDNPPERGIGNVKLLSNLISSYFN